MSAATVTPLAVPLDANWRLLGKCLDEAPDLMHPTIRDLYGQNQAKAICKGCPVLEKCLEDAIDTDDWNGIRGGMTGAERRRHVTGDRGRDCTVCGKQFMPRVKVQKRCYDCAAAHDGHRYGVNRRACTACGTTAWVDEETGQLGRHRVPGADRRRAACPGEATKPQEATA